MYTPSDPDAKRWVPLGDRVVAANVPAKPEHRISANVTEVDGKFETRGYNPDKPYHGAP